MAMDLVSVYHNKKFLGTAVSFSVHYHDYNNCYLMDGTILSSGLPKITIDLENGNRITCSEVVVKHDKKKKCYESIIIKDEYFYSIENFPQIPLGQIKSSSSFDNLAYKLPGVHEKVNHPVTMQEMFIIDIVVNLNDKYKWTREAIADWLDTLDVNLRFDIPAQK